MRLQPAIITLGTQQWTVRPLTVAQVQAIEPLVLGTADVKLGSVSAAVAILRIALGRDHAGAVVGLDEIEAGAPEIAAATATVLRLGGFLPGGDLPPGEAEAGLPPASTGPASTAG